MAGKITKATSLLFWMMTILLVVGFIFLYASILFDGVTTNIPKKTLLGVMIIPLVILLFNMLIAYKLWQCSKCEISLENALTTN